MLRVMTRNLFVGADLKSAYDALATAGGVARLPAAVAEIFNPGVPPGMVQRTDFAARTTVLADEIEAARPDLVGLQEAAVWRTRGLSGSGARLATETHDHLELLEAELARRRLGYRRVAVVDCGEVELPSAAGFNVGLSNHGAILARDGDRREGGLRLSNVQTGSFVNTLPIRTAYGTFSLTRGWASVDASLRGADVRFITTHLEVATSPEAAAVQLRQAGELVAGPAQAPMPVVMVGDFNARPGTPTYTSLLAAGFDDAWMRAHPEGLEGFTCCHAMPLDNPSDTLRRRIDLILTRGDIVAAEAFLVGDQPGAFTAGKWASDHAGVVATLASTGA